MAMDAGIPVIAGTSADSIRAEIADADIVQVQYWNTPELVGFMRELTLPTRLLLWCHVPGDTAPHQIHGDFVAWADMTVAASPYSHALPVFTALDEETRRTRTAMILDAPDLSRLADVMPQAHDTFNVGYIGTVDHVKMHKDYVAMSAAVRVPSARFLVYGSGNGFDALRREATALGAVDRFDFRGYVEDVGAVFATLDVFGYPITHSNAELVVQEAMCAGVPPVILNGGGVASTVTHGVTGLIVSSVAEYTQAIEFLYHHPDERARLGRQAVSHARRSFGAAIAADALSDVYDRMMAAPPRPRVWPLADGGPGGRTGARTFSSLLGATDAEPFVVSLESTVDREVLDAEARIAAVPPVLAEAGAGGVLHYRRSCLDDPHLRLWSGLVLEQQGRAALAIAEYEAARCLGIDHWRVSSYIARAAASIGAVTLAADAMRASDLARECAPQPDPWSGPDV
jgi:hypothetical protein